MRRLRMQVAIVLLLSGIGFWIGRLASFLIARQVGFVPCCIEDAQSWGTVDGLLNEGPLTHLSGLVFAGAIGASLFIICWYATGTLGRFAALFWGALVGAWCAAMFYPGIGIHVAFDLLWPSTDPPSAVSLTMGVILFGLLLLGPPHVLGWILGSVLPSRRDNEASASPIARA